jgi:hypothetical protein
MQDSILLSYARGDDSGTLRLQLNGSSMGMVMVLPGCNALGIAQEEASSSERKAAER